MTQSLTQSFKRSIALLSLALMGMSAQAAELTVSAASSLSNAFKELGPLFEARHPGTRLLFNFGASDSLLAQVAKGAPVDVLATADQETMDKAESQQLLLAGTRRNFAGNELVLVVPAQGGQTLKSLAELARPEIGRIALGKPEGVPAGRYARRALEAAGLWSSVQAKAIYAINVRQALDYVARGEVDAGLVYATDAAAQRDKVRLLFSVATETPISYPIAALKLGPKPAMAQRFIEFVASPPAQDVLAKHGFRKP